MTHTIVRNGRVAAEFRARQVRNFPRAGRTELDGVIYSEYDRNGIPVAAGNAVHAVYYTERKDADLIATATPPPTRAIKPGDGSRLPTESVVRVSADCLPKKGHFHR